MELRVPLTLPDAPGWQQTLRNYARAAQHEWQTFRHGYPEFVLSAAGSLEAGEIPAFVFHSIEPVLFERQLRHLSENGYRGIGVDEYLAITSGAVRGTGREVLLTIDDARSSVWRYAVPLLRRHRQRAILFVMTGWTQDADGLRPNLDSDGHDPASIERQDPGDHSLCTWPELRAMRAAGVIDVQSHSHRHARVFSDTRLLGVIGPGHSLHPYDCAASPYLAAAPEPWRVDVERMRGLPLFETEALCAGRPHFELDDAIAERIAAVFRELGQGVGRDRPQGLLAEVRRCVPELLFRPVDQAEAYRRVLDELGRARDLLVEHLGSPQAGRAFCVPFTEGGEATLRAARELGIEAVFWGASSQRRLNRVGDDPALSSRIKNDFLMRLPGTGRRSLAQIYTDKVRRRLAGSTGY
ncbi:MAG: polysaccharide deacetylase family protein [Pseudomonadales bacterium]|nr:polysaccharide deacetylase family protein [Pseudomonadales bacterium]MCP5328997.1 polysaccharide deacetylase family protein [Nevskiaceae bacterium]MCP5339596.1 polysaccharide deacetylase family protein [Nevskiaceae bacterium]